MTLRLMFYFTTKVTCFLLLLRATAEQTKLMLKCSVFQFTVHFFAQNSTFSHLTLSNLSLG